MDRKELWKWKRAISKCCFITHIVFWNISEKFLHLLELIHPITKIPFVCIPNHFYANSVDLFLYLVPAAAAATLLQSCPTLCDPIDGCPPGSPVPGILQARTLEWVAISFSNTWRWKVKVKLLSRVRLLVTPWTAAYQAPLSMGFSRQEYWSGVPLPSPFLGK